jgi:ribosomal protein S21
LRPYLRKTHHKEKKGLVEWLKVYTLSSSPSTAKKKKNYAERKRTGTKKTLDYMIPFI